MPYLDFNATTPVDPEVLEAMLPFLGGEYGNPSSDYPLGQRAKAALDEARAKVLRALGAPGGQVVFTGCGTEANQLAILGSLLPRRRGWTSWWRRFRGPGHLVISDFEHPATIQTAEQLREWGFAVTRVSVDTLGFVDPERIRSALRPDTVLVSVMHANNEVGSIQPLAEIAAILRPRGILFHTDAAQTIGKLPVSPIQLGVDLLSFTGHKFYAPKGIGGLWMRDGVTLEPVLRGGGQEKGLRSGTENVAFAVGVGLAMERAVQAQPRIGPRMVAMRERLWTLLQSGLGERIRRTTDPDRCLPNTLHICVRNALGSDLLHRASGLMASTGSACHAGQNRPSAVLCAMGLPHEWSLGAIRLSLGKSTTEAEVDEAARMLIGAVG